jgi:hypothetical protein
LIENLESYLVDENLLANQRLIPVLIEKIELWDEDYQSVCAQSIK